jgi:hypothetical protein
MDRHEQKRVITFLFMQMKRYKAMHRELTTVLIEGAANLETIKRQCRCFKDGDFRRLIMRSPSDSLLPLESYNSISQRSTIPLSKAICQVLCGGSSEEQDVLVAGSGAAKILKKTAAL